jgi:transposase InsO family protein
VGEPAGRHRIARLMRLAGLRGSRKRGFIRTTDSRHDQPVMANLLDRCFDVKTPNAVWASDITYIPTGEGWLFLAVVLDLFSRRVVGWAMSERIDTRLAVSALEMALAQRDPPAGLLHHSDRGAQYASDEYQLLLHRRGIQSSMSRVGDCWDNAVAESFFATLKTELVHDRRYATRQEAKADVFEFIEVFYNRQRLHSSLGYETPAAFEEMKAAA